MIVFVGCICFGSFSPARTNRRVSLNWIVGVLLLVADLLLSFNRLSPAVDQLAILGRSVGSNWRG